MVNMKAYIKPNTQWMSICTEHFIANSPTPNNVTDDCQGVGTGGYSSEGGSEDNGNGSVGDMAKKHNSDAWTLWDE